jgi:enoyl-CoA hydratase
MTSSAMSSAMTSSAMSSAVIDVTTEGRVALITINRPEARNAVNGEVAAGLEAAIDRLEADDDLWVGILTGAGPVFCAGADLKAINAGEAASLATKRGGFAGFVQREREKPVIAAVNGPALAGGCELVLACDLAAAAGALFRLPRKLPINLALEMVMTGEPIDAERAHHFGLVNRLTDPGQAVEGARELAEAICANAPIAVRESRKVLLATLGVDEEAGWRLSGQAFAAAMSTEDFLEGPRAFIEKREPQWKGR